MEVFAHRDKEQALQLLSSVNQPNTIRSTDDFGDLPSGSTLLHYAARRGWSDVCRTLVEQYQCRVDETDDAGSNALHTACVFGEVAVVKYLLTLRSVLANIAARDRHGRTPLERVTANKYEVLSLFASLVDSRMELPVDAFFNIFMLGK